MTQITVGVSDCVTGHWYILIGGIAARRLRLPALEEDRRAVATSGTGSSCGSRSRSATSSRRSRSRAGRGPSRARSPPACRSSRRSDRRRDLGQRGDRGGDGRRLRLGQARRHDRGAASSSPMSSRRWSPHGLRRRGDRRSSSTMLDKIADFYEAEVDAKIKALTSLIEPLHDHLRRRHRRLHRDLDVPADLQPLRQDPLSRQAARSAQPRRDAVLTRRTGDAAR